MNLRHGRGPLLLERFWAALRRDRAASPPAGLDPAIADLTIRLVRELQPRALEPSASFEARLERRLQEQAGTQPGERAWAGPAINPNAHRRTALPPETDATTEQRIMSSTTDTTHDPVPIQQRRWAREALKIAAAALVFAIIGVVLVLALRDDGDDRQIVPADGTPEVLASPTANATMQAALQALTATAGAEADASGLVARITVGSGPSRLAFGAGAIWVPNTEDGTVSRIDPANNEVVATIQISAVPVDGIASPGWVVALDDEIWVLNNLESTLVHVDPATNQVDDRIRIPGTLGNTNFRGVAAGAGSLWVADADLLDNNGISHGRVLRIDPRTKEILASIEVPETISIAFSDDSAWVLSFYQGTVTRIDLATNTVVATFEAGSDHSGIAVGAGSVWVGDQENDRILRIDPETNEVVATIEDVPSSFTLSVDANGVWVSSRGQGLRLIDPATNVATVKVPTVEVQGIAYGDGATWVTIPNSSAVLRLQP